MVKNRLQRSLEHRLARGPVIDLIDTNFHRAGYLLPEGILAPLLAEYVHLRSYAPDPKGSSDARQAIAQYYRRHGAGVDPDNILITASASESYHLLFNTLAAPGDNVLLPRPGYPLFEYLAAHSHLESRFYRLDPEAGYAIDGQSLRREIDGRTAFVVLISPNNPTGHVASEREIEDVLAVCGERGLMLISDEVFSEFLHDVPSLPRAAALARQVPVFTLNGVSKMFASPDLKLSWIAAAGGPRTVPDLVEKLEIANDVYLSCSAPAQFLLPHLFARCEDFQRGMVRSVGACRSILLEAVEGIPGVRLVPPQGGIHGIVEISGTGLEDEELAVRLLEERSVYTHPGYYYDIDDRVSLVLSFLKEQGQLQEGLLRLRRFLGR